MEDLAIADQFAQVLSAILNLPMFSPPNMLWVPICQSFLPPKFLFVRYSILILYKSNLQILTV